jgi:hypothetical protein
LLAAPSKRSEELFQPSPAKVTYPRWKRAWLLITAPVRR